MLNQKVTELLKHYANEPFAIRAGLARLLNFGALAGSGKMAILPIDQGFEHGPWSSFGTNPRAFDPSYAFELAHHAGFSGVALPRGLIEFCPDNMADIPMIMKINHSNAYSQVEDQAVVANINDAVRMGCVGIGITIYPGSEYQISMFEQVSAMIAEARSAGLLTVVWSYPRGGVIPSEHNVSLDVCCYAVHMAALLGAHIIKTKIPKNSIFRTTMPSCIDKNNKCYPIEAIMQSAFDGKRIVLFSGGSLQDQSSILNDCKMISEGGGHGVIIGRNAFGRNIDEARTVLQDIYQAFL